MNTHVLNSIYSDIAEIADSRKQRLYWLGGDPNHVSSYIEVMSRLFDDNDFDYFVDDESKSSAFSKQLREELGSLREMLNSYQEKATDLAIIEDPAWERVGQQARVVLASWDNQ